MNVHLTAELEQLVQSKVKSGRYNSASEVVREALRLLEERDQLLELRKEAIRQKIDAGWESLRRGEGVDGEAFFADLERQEQALAQPQHRLGTGALRTGSTRSRLSHRHCARSQRRQTRVGSGTALSCVISTRTADASTWDSLRQSVPCSRRRSLSRCKVTSGDSAMPMVSHICSAV